MVHGKRSSIFSFRATLVLLCVLATTFATAQLLGDGTEGEEQQQTAETATTPTTTGAATTTTTTTTTQPAAAAPATDGKKEDGKKGDEEEEEAKGGDAPSGGDKNVGYPIFSVFELDLSKMEITAPAGSQTPNARNLPFDVPFLLRVKGTEHVKTLNFGLRELSGIDLQLPVQNCENLKAPLAAKIKSEEALNAAKKVVTDAEDAVKVDGLSDEQKVAKQKALTDANTKLTAAEDVLKKAYQALKAVEEANDIHCACDGCAFNKCISSFKRQPLLTGDAIVAVPPLKANRFYTLCLDITSRPSKLDSSKFSATIGKSIAKAVSKNGGNWMTNAKTHDETLKLIIKQVEQDVDRFIENDFKERQGYTDASSPNVRKLIEEAGFKEFIADDLRASYQFTEGIFENAGGHAKDQFPLFDAIFKNTKRDKNLTGQYGAGAEKSLSDNPVTDIQTIAGVDGLLKTISANTEHVKNAIAAQKPKDPKKPTPAEVNDKKVLEGCVEYMDGLAKALEDHKRALKRANTVAADLMDRLVIDLLSQITLTGTTSGDFKTRASWYLAPDVGYAFVYGDSRPVKQTPYFGIQVHIAPINREANYGFFRDWGVRNRKGELSPGSLVNGLVNKLAKSISFSAAVTSVDIDKAEDHKGLVGDKMGLMLGGALRLNEFLRVGCGSLLTQRRSEQPLSSDFKINSNFYWGVSIDIDLIGYIQRIATNRAAGLANK